MLVVDDEPDNLDLLYRTFRREFNVLRAESGQAALDVLREHGEVAVIISDQRMPEMKGTEFLSKTVPDFPDTVRIILTGFTDVEDLVDAINAGQVYRYITKPWDPDALKRVVQQAAKTYELLKQRGDALEQVALQQQLITDLVQSVATAHSLENVLPTIATSLQAVLSASGCVVFPVQRSQLGDTVGVAGTASAEGLRQDGLVALAIADKTPQAVANVATHPQGETYQASGCQAIAAVPACFQETVLAVVVWQWQTPQTFSAYTHQLMTLAAQQLGLALAYCRTQFTLI
jgi:CheY-like chemotaxis protein